MPGFGRGREEKRPILDRNLVQSAQIDTRQAIGQPARWGLFKTCKSSREPRRAFLRLALVVADFKFVIDAAIFFLLPFIGLFFKKGGNTLLTGLDHASSLKIGKDAVIGRDADG